MSITQRRSLDSNAIKLIAILAMTVDHIAWAVFPGYPRAALPLLMHLIGRITCPIMCYFIAEGFHYTHDVRKYTARLFLFALFSHFCYLYASNDFVDWHSFIPFYYGSLLNQTSVMWALAWGLVMLRVANSDKIVDRLKPLLIILICVVSFPSDWSCVASLCVLAFGTNRGDLKKQATLAGHLCGDLRRGLLLCHRRGLWAAANGRCPRRCRSSAATMGSAGAIRASTA